MFHYASRMTYMRGTADATRLLLESMPGPGVITFGGGAPAKDALPVETIYELAKEVLSRDARGVEALQYGKPMGLPEVRQAAIDHLLKRRGLEGISLDEVLAVGGGMEGVYVVAGALLNPGDVVLVETPTFVQSLETFELFEAQCIGCPCEDDGIDLNALEDNIKKYHPKLIYIIPTFQNPSGRTTSLEKRKELARLANQYDVALLEDDPYGLLRYSGKDIAPIKAFDKTGNVIYANSFSKIFSPGSRLGYVYGSKELIDRLYDVKTATNSHVGMISQILCAEFFNRGYFDKHLEKICQVHKAHRDVMMECLATMMPEGTKYVYPDGGLFSWVELPGDVDTSSWVAEAAEKKVAYIPGERFFPKGQPVQKNCIRLSFGSPSVEEITIGMERLSQVIKSHY